MKFSRWIILVIFLVLVLSCKVVTFVRAGEEAVTTTEAKKAPERLAPPEIKKKIAGLRERIKLARLAENEQTAKQTGVTLNELLERTASLRSIESTYERLLTTLKKKEALEGEETVLHEKLQVQQQIGMAQGPPYTLSFYDSILDALEMAEQQKESAELAVKLGRRSLEDATMRLENAQKELRIVKDRLEPIIEKKKPQEINWSLEKAELGNKLAEALVSFEKANNDNLLKQVKLADLHTDISRHKIAWVRANLYFDKTDLDKQLKTIEYRRNQLKKRIQKLVQGKKQAEDALLTSQERFASTTDKELVPVAAAALKEREAWVKTYQAVLEQTEDMLEFLGHQEQARLLRYGLLKEKIDNDKILSKRDEIKNHIEKLNRVLGIQQSFQINLQSQITAVENRISDEGVEPQVKYHLKNEMKAMQTLAKRRLEYISALLATQQIGRRVLDEMNLRLKQISLKQRLMKIKGGFQKIWNFEIWVIDNHAVTVRKLIVAFFVFIICILTVKYFLRSLGSRLVSHALIKETTAPTINKILTYFAYVLILLLVLRIIHIPLTAFAFLGGAMAIGVGFGAQTLINNFISGFILLGERPIRIGDLIEMEGNFAIVEDIGARCTRIRTGANVDILVPNSSFLEKNITNWTLSNKNVRAHVTVGVAYGSPVRKVEDIMLKAAGEYGKVLSRPEPFVLFNEFGDNALIFDVYFWLSMTRIMQRRIIESDIRFRIDKLFREAGIIIAFPQQDVHLDTQRPLEFCLIDSKE